MDAAWQWLCRRRQTYPPDADIWHLRFHRERELPRLIREAESGTYRLSPMQVIRRKPGQESLVQWSARDALVLKWVSLQLNGKLPLSPRCTHTAGHRGGRSGLQEITTHLSAGYRFMYRTDIRGYYRHISKAQLKRHVERFVPEQHLRQVIHQYIDYSVEDGGEFYTPPSGIPRGCALSPFLGASFLWYVDGGFERERGLFYVRYMDDFYFCLSAAGRCAGQLAGCISTLMTQDLSVIRTKPQSVGLRRALTGWVSGLMKGGPSG